MRSGVIESGAILQRSRALGGRRLESRPSQSPQPSPGLVFALRAWFQRWTTETDVTNMRVVHKEGFIKRRTFEMSLDKVESVDVDQSIAGRIFGWGDVTIRGVGEGKEVIKFIGSPIEFRNHITTQSK